MNEYQEGYQPKREPGVPDVDPSELERPSGDSCLEPYASDRKVAGTPPMEYMIRSQHVVKDFMDCVGEFGPFQSREIAEETIAILAAREDVIEAVLSEQKPPIHP